MSSPEQTHGRSCNAAMGGAVLIDLLVGLGIGSLAIGAAIASLLVAREAAGAVNDMSLLQQQSAHAMRVLGLQIRTAGSAELQASRGGVDSVRFVTLTLGSGGGENFAAVRGTHGNGRASDILRLAQISPPLLPSHQRDCLGQDAAPGERSEASFEVDGKGSLRCRSSSGQNQPLVAGVEAFKVRYRARQGTEIRSLRAREVEAARLWDAVVAVEVCLDLRGEERNAAHDGRYTDCTGQVTSNDGRLHLVTRRLFALRARSDRG